ncbi:MAG: histidine phosphatase family protein [Lachnospiraceae bacterium]|nr:histidine phosphatase family protein [Lachnospiraceae bacterium]
MQIYMMRHGETDWNLQKRMQGRADIPLNAAGLEQARRAAEELREIRFDRIYSSPLCRARVTAERIAEGRGLPVLTDERLTEIGFGILEGSERGMNPEAHAYFHDPAHYHPCEGGESYEELDARCADVLENLLIPLEKQCRTILVCSHGGWINGVIRHILNRPLEDFWKDPPRPNCGCVLVDCTEGKLCLL